MPAVDPLWYLFIVVAFVAGSIPFSLLIGLARGVDIRTVGSKNVGATNLGRALGGRSFALGFTCDMLKGLLPTLGAGVLTHTAGSFKVETLDACLWLAVVAAAVLGHMFSPWVKFRGGKGVATGLGALLGVFPALTIPAAGSFVVFLVVFGLWRYVSAASVVAACSLPVWVILAFGQVERFAQQAAMDALSPETTTAQAADLARAQATSGFHPAPFVIVSFALAGLVVYRHRANLRRLLEGTEPRVGGSQKLVDAPEHTR